MKHIHIMRKAIVVIFGKINAKCSINTRFVVKQRIPRERMSDKNLNKCCDIAYTADEIRSSWSLSPKGHGRADSAESGPGDDRIVIAHGYPNPIDEEMNGKAKGCWSYLTFKEDC